MTISQTALFGDVLSSADQYHKEAACFHADMTGEELYAWRDKLACRAQSGDAEACRAFIESYIRCVCYWADRYCRVYSWASSDINYMELVSLGNFTVVEYVDMALQKDSPGAWLAAKVRYVLLDFCSRHAKDPVVSLDNLLDGENGDFYLRLISADESPSFLRPLQRPDFSVSDLHQALDTLPDDQRDIVARLFGISGSEPQALCDIGRNCFDGELTADNVQKIRNKAFARLRQHLLLTSQETYTTDEAMKLLNVKQARFSALMAQYGVCPVVKGRYPKRAIEAIAQGSLSPVQKKQARRQSRCAVPCTFKGDLSEVYTLAQACEVLGVDRQGLFYLNRKYRVTPLAKGVYPKQAIDEIARLRSVKTA